MAKNAAQIQLNCVSLVELTGFVPACWRLLRADLIINVASTVAFQPLPEWRSTAPPAVFVLSFTEALWQETKSSGVRVRCPFVPGRNGDRNSSPAMGEQFMTSGRQDLQAGVVDTAMAAIDKVDADGDSGWRNMVGCQRLPRHPRRLMLMVFRSDS